MDLIERLRLQTTTLATIRHFFEQRKIVEVITPCIIETPSSEPFVSSFAVEGTRWLRSSPEYQMKRLLLAFQTDIYQIGSAFRKDEHGKNHLDEFILLEWYRIGWDYRRLMIECLMLLTTLITTSEITKRSTTYRELFTQRFKLDPFLCDDQALYTVAKQEGYHSDCQQRSEALDFLFDLATSTYQDPAKHSCLLAIYDFPIAQASFARISGEHAERFEIFFDGIELANGYSELTVASDYRQRIAADNEVRAIKHLPPVAPDEDFLQALEDNPPLPNCAGVSVGLERLMMCATQSDDIHQISLFSDS